MQITWKIENLEREIATGLVTVIHWRATSQDQGKSHSIYGSLKIVGDANAEAFVAYQDITESMALTWLHDRMREANKLDNTVMTPEDVETSLARHLTEIMAPKYRMGRPWL